MDWHGALGAGRCLFPLLRPCDSWDYAVFYRGFCLDTGEGGFLEKGSGGDCCFSGGIRPLAVFFLYSIEKCQRKLVDDRYSAPAGKPGNGNGRGGNVQGYPADPYSGAAYLSCGGQPGTSDFRKKAAFYKAFHEKLDG